VLLDMGFDQTLTTIMSALPKMRRTGLFSATGTAGSNSTGRGMKELMRRAGMRNPVWVNVAIAASNQESDIADLTEQATPSSLTNYYLVAPLDEKLSRLVSFFRTHPNEKMIVFFLSCAVVEFYGAALQQLMKKDESFSVELLHGKMVQKRREKTMERFRLPETNGALLCTDVAARGLDVTDVDWVVQFDAPTDPASFVHRVGRSARAGRVGSSLVFLTPKEDSYVELLTMRKVPLRQSKEICAPPIADEDGNDQQDNEEDENDDDDEEEEAEEKERVIKSCVPNQTIPNILPKIRKMVMQDRDLLEKGTKAYTSYIRAYKEHHCAFIFRFSALDLGLLATSFCLLRLPKMPELRGKEETLVNFKPAGPEVNIHAIAFKDKIREQARQKRLAAELAAGGKNAKQIKAEQRAAERARKEKERKVAERAKGRNPHKKKGRQAQIFDEWEDLAKEERLYKKMRKGKITKEQFDELMYGKKEQQQSDDDDEVSMVTET